MTDKMVDDQFAMRLRSAFTITKIQDAGEHGLGSVSEAEVRGVKAPTLDSAGTSTTSWPTLPERIASSRRFPVQKR